MVRDTSKTLTYSTSLHKPGPHSPQKVLSLCTNPSSQTFAYLSLASHAFTWIMTILVSYGNTAYSLWLSMRRVLTLLLSLCYFMLPYVSAGPSPSPRDSHVAVVHGRSMYLYGGSTGSAMGDFHELRLEFRRVWRPVTLPGKTFDACGSFDPDDPSY